jgi:hypothetical protein
MCSYTQALCLSAQPPLLYDITKIPDYCDAFSDLYEKKESLPGALWLSDEVARLRGGRGPALRAHEREIGSSVAAI